MELHDGIMFISNPGWFQDAITYAVENGFPLVAMGRGAEGVGNTTGPTKIRVTDGPILVPRSLFAPNLDLRAVQVEVTGDNGFVRDSCALGLFYWPMLIAYHGDGAAMLWDAEGYTPVDNGMGFSNNEEHFRAVVVQGGADSATCFRFKAGTFSENRIMFQELFGQRRPQEGGGVIDTLIEIENAPGFRHNLMVGGHLHGFRGDGIKAGSSLAANIHDNQWQIAKIAPSPGAISAVGVRSYGSYDSWEVAVSNNEMSPGETFAHAAVLQGVGNRINGNASTSGGRIVLGELTTREVTIAAGESLSEAIELDGSLVAIHMPSDWTDAPISFLASDNGSRFSTLANSGGAELVISACKSQYVPLEGLSGVVHLKVRSGTAYQSIVQTLDRTIKLITASSPAA